MMTPRHQQKSVALLAGILLAGWIVLPLIASGDALVDDDVDGIIESAKAEADRAAAIYFDELTRNGMNWMVLLGVPDPRVREEVAATALSLFEAAQAAERAVQNAILDLEAHPDFAGSRDLRRKRQELAHAERDRRVPFLIGAGAFWHGQLGFESGDDQRKRRMQLAAETLETMLPRMEGNLRDQAALHAGFALHELEYADAADTYFREVRDREGASALHRFVASLGVVRVEAHRRQPGEAVRMLDDLTARAEPLGRFGELLLADQHAQLARRAADRASGRSAERWNERAFSRYLEIIDRASEEDAAAVRQLIFTRIRRLIDPGVDVSAMPALVVIAQADALGREDATLDEAAELFESALARDDLAEAEAVLALRGLARVKQSLDEVLEASRAHFRVARDFPRAREAEDSVQRAATLAAQAYRNRERHAADALRETLALMFERYEHLRAANSWRLFAGRLDRAEGRYAEALEQIEPVMNDDDPSRVIDALSLRLGIKRDALRRAHDSGEARVWRERTAKAEAELRQAFDRLAQSAPTEEEMRSVEQLRVQLEILLAEIALSRGEYQRALDRVDGIDEEDEAMTSDLLAEILQSRINAYQGLGERSRARETLTQFLDAAPERVGDVLVPMVEGAESEVRRLLERGQENEAQRLASRELLPLAEQYEAWLERQAEPAPIASRQRIADAYRFAGEYDQAQSRYAELRQERPNAAPVLIGLAECLYHTADSDDVETLGEAMQLYRRLTASGRTVGEQIYWLAQLRSLQILDRIQRNTQQIGPQIERLRMEDEDLGGPRFRPHFDELERKHN
ncbi:MAG: hypothetical protein EA377_07145 [Phycisphaerales bacterium]|nr:MAG: hypothetical protein EA377_07145 [Phycisphaerales bacterium]